MQEEFHTQLLLAAHLQVQGKKWSLKLLAFPLLHMGAIGEEWWRRESTPLVTMELVLAVCWVLSWNARLWVSVSSSNSLSTLQHLSLWGVQVWQGEILPQDFFTVFHFCPLSREWIHGMLPPCHCKVTRSGHPQGPLEVVFSSWNLRRVFQGRNLEKSSALPNTSFFKP